MALSGNPQPRWRVTLDGRDISGAIAPRLMSLGITAERGQEADQLDLTVSDHDGRLELPRRGVVITAALGWDTTGLTDLGSFHVDEVAHAGTPDHVTLRARSAPVAQAMRQKRDASYHATTVGALVNLLAGRNGLAPHCAAKLASIALTHLDQTNESDLNLLTRLGQQYDATATVKAACLIFAPIGKGLTATGATLPALTVVRRDGDQHRYHSVSRNAYTGVRAWWHDVHAAKKRAAIAGSETSLKTLRPTYATAADALQAAQAEYQRIQRGEATFNLHLARGNAGAAPEMPLHVRGWHPTIDATDWLIKRVEHRLDESGFTTTIEAETRAAAATKAT